MTTPSTSVLINPGAGVWYYRVRGVDKTLPTKMRGMTWSDRAVRQGAAEDLHGLEAPPSLST